MTYRSCLVLILCIPLSCFAQKRIDLKSGSISYFAPVGVDPGAKASVQYLLPKLSTRFTGNVENPSGFFVNGQLAYFRKTYYYQSTLLNAEFGWRRQRLRKKSYSAFSVGTGYLLRFEAMNLNVNFKGETDVTDWDPRSYFMPSVAYEGGKRINRKWSWYAKLTYGYAMSNQHENKGIPFAEVGVHYSFKANSVRGISGTPRF